MNKIMDFLKAVGLKTYNIIDKVIVVPISKIIYRIVRRSRSLNKLEKILNRPSVLLYISLALAVILFFLVDSKVINLTNTAEIITGQQINVKYNSNAYVIEGLPKTVDITLMGRKSDLYLAKQLGNHEVILDLTGYEPSDKPQKVKLTYNQTIDSLTYKLDPSYVTITIKKKVSTLKNITYDLINSEKMDAKLSVKSVELSKNEVVVKGSQDTIDKISSVKALIDLADEKFTTKGTYEVDNVALVAYDNNGMKMANVEIVATNVTAKVDLDSYSIIVPVKVITTGDLVAGKAISGMTINGKDTYSVTIYGEQAVIDNITGVPVTVDINGQGNNGTKSYSVTISKPSGVRYISETNIAIALSFAEAKQRTIDNISIEQKNIPSGLSATAKTIEDSVVSVQLTGVQSVIDAITPESINAYIDLAGYTVGEHTIEVKVEGEDARVKYAVTKKINIKLDTANKS
ncbi:MAG TPA: CdaR family protein [Bacilli bacterium]|nr:CdaR family protein [Bacilli bacterium]